MDKLPHYYDPENGLEAAIEINQDGTLERPAKIHVILPSDVWISPEVARAFGEALIRAADHTKFAE